MLSKISNKNLVKSAKNATDKAIKRTKLAGGAITFQHGRKIIKQYIDGREEVVGILDKAYVTPTKKLYKLS